ncbi:MAG: NusG domain II-containing protein [candidate division KSB1 bacterium]|nr:NusG domain II-containing protein [candidate division KSB1 bacterium]MDZ7365640.1 NusG domain II-containing protein [candidate division KSB1 bacterium]MDZ7403284.1 NusG domain II-containing protein [candidate division KSB1 bacterium]
MRTATKKVLNLLLSLRVGDGFIFVLFIALAVGSFWVGGFVRAKDKAAANVIAVITVGNHEIAAVNLADSSDFKVHGALGEMALRVENNGIRVRRSACPNQVCVKQGAARRPGEMLVCVPNRMIVFIRGKAATEMPPASEKTPVERRGDAVTY